MKNQLYILLLFAISSVCFANSAPTVSSVTVPPPRTDGSGIVDIYYTLSDADGDRCTISLVVSNDGGSSYTITPTSLSGDLINVSSGPRHIIWNSKADLPGVYGTDYRVRVTADDNYLNDGLVAYYKLDGTSGPVVDSVDSHDGVNHGAVIATGKIGNAFDFDGNDKIDLPNLGISGSMPRTVSMWVKNGTKTSSETLIGWSRIPHVARNNFVILTNNKSIGDVYINFSSNDYHTEGGLISSSNFTFIAVTYDGGTLSTSTVHVYVNGIERSLSRISYNSGAANTADSNYIIGYNPVSTSVGYDGKIDEVRIYNRALSSAEIQSLYQNP